MYVKNSHTEFKENLYNGLWGSPLMVLFRIYYVPIPLKIGISPTAFDACS
jgi:hypothetical protein